MPARGDETMGGEEEIREAVETMRCGAATMERSAGVIPGIQGAWPSGVPARSRAARTLRDNSGQSGGASGARIWRWMRRDLRKFHTPAYSIAAAISRLDGYVGSSLSETQKGAWA